MNRTNFIKKIKENSDVHTALKDIDKILSGIEITIKNAVLEDDVVTIPEICKISSKDIKAKSGISRIGGIEKSWTKPSHKEGSIKILPSFKKIFEERWWFLIKTTDDIDFIIPTSIRVIANIF